MATLTVVSNSSPLIGLQQIGLLTRLAPLFAEVFIPPAVAREIAPSVARPAWVVERALTQPIDPRVLSAALDPGETEAIGLAMELQTHGLVLDDRPARRLAQMLGLPVIGTLGVLLAAKRAAILPTIRPSIEALLDAGFYVSRRIVEQALAEASEGA